VPDDPDRYGARSLENRIFAMPGMAITLTRSSTERVETLCV